MDPRNSLMDGFTLWLEEVASGNRVSQRAPLDSFATSARNCGRTAPWLHEIAAGEQPNASDVRQAVTDLQGMQLAVRSGDIVQLTPLGEVVLERWSVLGVDQDDMDAHPNHEVIRSCVLVSAALSTGVGRYQAQFDFWCDLVELRPPEYWLSGEVWDIYLPSYLNGTDERGYNPYVVLRALGAGLGSLEQWQQWAADPEAPALLGKFISRVSGNRPGGRRNFLKAMEAYRINKHEPARLAPTLSVWGI